MEHQYYLPRADQGKAEWLSAFANVLATYAVALGLSPSQVGAVLADANFFGEVVTSIPGFKDYFQTITAYKNALRDGSANPIGPFPALPALPANPPVNAGVFKRNTELVRAIKANPAYTTAMGENLHIIGAELDPAFETIKPLITVSIHSLHAYVKWKHEHTDSADIYADYADGAGFIYIGRITPTHYLDPHLPAAGQTKIYKYKIRYVVADEQVGEYSDVAEITVTG